MSLLVSWMVSSLAFWVAGKALPGIQLKRFWDAVVVAAIFGVLNWLLGLLLFVVIGVATLGIGFVLGFVTRLIVTAIILQITDSFTELINIKSFGWAIAGAAFITVSSTIVNRLLVM
ncbi:MAG: phage holin family protein [Proteobacteria bacterium]|nr:phage holin family protein [Pseudomonadota bacterium]